MVLMRPRGQTELALESLPVLDPPEYTGKFTWKGVCLVSLLGAVILKKTG